MVKEIRGILGLLATPFTKEYEINEEALRMEIDWIIGKGADGIIVTGSVGEFVSLSDEERKRVFKTCIDHVGGKIITVASTSGGHALQTIEMTKYAEDLGYDGAMIVPTYYWRCTEKEVYRYYRMISEVTDIPLIPYHNPDLSKFYMKPEFVLRLTEIPNIVAIKEVVSDTQHIQKLMMVIGEKINVLQYTTGFLVALILGAEGGTIEPFFIPQAVELKKAIETGNIKEAVDIHQKIIAICPTIRGEADTGVVAFFKAATSIATGVDMGPPRPPYLPLSNNQYVNLRKRLKGFYSDP